MNDYLELRLGDIVNPVQERMVDRTKWHFDKYIAGEHIDSGEVRIRKCGQIKGNEEVIGSAFHMSFKPGHVLYSTRRAYLRKAGIVDFEGICSNVTLVLQADEEKLLQSLLPFILQSEAFVQFAISHSVGSTNPFVKWTDLSKYKILVPPLAIQKKISRILWAIENNIEKTMSLLQISEKLKKGVLEKLLTKGIGHKEFKKTELGEIPEEWEISSFPKAIEVNPARKLKNGFEYCRVEMADIEEWNPRIIHFEKAPFNGGGSKFKNGDVLMARITPCLENGKTVLVDILGKNECGFGSTEFTVLTGREGTTLSKYVYYLCTSPVFRKMAIDAMVGTTGRQRVPKDFFDSTRIPLPSILEQKKIVDILDNFTGVSMDYNFLLNNLRKLKSKITNSLLSGELIIPKENLN